MAAPPPPPAAGSAKAAVTMLWSVRACAVPGADGASVPRMSLSQKTPSHASAARRVETSFGVAAPVSAPSELFEQTR